MILKQSFSINYSDYNSFYHETKHLFSFFSKPNFSFELKSFCVVLKLTPTYKRNKPENHPKTEKLSKIIFVCVKDPSIMPIKTTVMRKTSTLPVQDECMQVQYIEVQNSKYLYKTSVLYSTVQL